RISSGSSSVPERSVVVVVSAAVVGGVEVPVSSGAAVVDAGPVPPSQAAAKRSAAAAAMRRFRMGSRGYKTDTSTPSRRPRGDSVIFRSKVLGELFEQLHDERPSRPSRPRAADGDASRPHGLDDTISTAHEATTFLHRRRGGAGRHVGSVDL